MANMQRSNIIGSSGNDLLSSIIHLGKGSHEIFEEAWQFPKPVIDDDPFNLQNPNFKFEDISIYLSLDENDDQGLKFLMNLEE